MEKGAGKILLIGAISEALTNIKCGCKLRQDEEEEGKEEEEDKAQSTRTQREEESEWKTKQTLFCQPEMDVRVFGGDKRDKSAAKSQ